MHHATEAVDSQRIAHPASCQIARGIPLPVLALTAHFADFRAAMTLTHLARDGEFDLAGKLCVLADFERLNIVPQPFAVAPRHRRAFRQHHLRMDDAALGGKIVAAIKSLVAQSRARAVGGRRYRAAPGLARAARSRYQAARARHDMRTWQVERHKRTRRLIELGGLIVKAGIADLTGDDRTIILGALLWMAEKLKSDQHEQARALWAAKGKQGFEAVSAMHKGTDRTGPAAHR
jgi:hypothetical protein